MVKIWVGKALSFMQLFQHNKSFGENVISQIKEHFSSACLNLNRGTAEQ